MSRLGNLTVQSNTGARWRRIDLAPLREFQGLRMFMNGFDTSVARIEPLVGHPLTNLVLSEPGEVSDLHLVPSFQELAHLQFDFGLPNLPLGDILPSGCGPLELAFRHHNKTSDLDYLRTSPNSLGHIRMISFPKLDNVEGLLSQADSLTGFEYYGEVNPGLDLSVLKNLPHLETLQLNHEQAITDPVGRVITSLSSLRKLELSHDDLPVQAPGWLREIPELRTLRIHGRGSLDLTSLAGVTGLTVEVARFRSLKVTGAELLGEGSRVVRDAPFLLRK